MDLASLSSHLYATHAYAGVRVVDARGRRVLRELLVGDAGRRLRSGRSGGDGGRLLRARLLGVAEAAGQAGGGAQLQRALRVAGDRVVVEEVAEACVRPDRVGTPRKSVNGSKSLSRS